MRTALTTVAAVSTLVLAVFVVAPSRADDKDAKQGDGKQALTGYLMDLECAPSILKKPDVEKAAAAHTKDCATEEDCAKEGYGVIVGKKVIKFDDRGNELAKEFLKKTEKEDHLRVKVEGTVKGDQIEVATLAAAEEEKK